jgi:hypothetical protein
MEEDKKEEMLGNNPSEARNRKFVLFILFVFLSVTTFLPSFAFANSDLPVTIIYKINDPYMTVNGKKFEIDPVTRAVPVIIKEWGRSVVPIRSLVETLGGSVGWDSKERKVSISFKSSFMELWIDNPKVRIDGAYLWIDDNNHNVKPLIINGRTMMPLRFVAENLGCKVMWSSELQTINITFPAPVIQLESKEIVKSVNDNETVVVNVPVANPFNFQIKIKIKLITQDCPENWSCDFCIKNACYFKEGEIVLEKKEKTTIQVSIYTVKASNANFTLKVFNNEIPEEIFYISLKEDG